MSKILLILINDYPYRNGETFFENEIDFLSSKFKKIIVFSVHGSKREKATRSVKDNVVVFPLSCTHNRLVHVLRGFFAKNNKFSTSHIKGKKLLMAMYLKGKNVFIFKKCKKYLHKLILDSNEDYCVYSYWLTLGIAAILLRNYLSDLFKKEIRSISRCHRYDIYNELMPLNYHPFQKEVISGLDSVYSCSEHGMDYLRAKYPELKQKISIARLSTNDHGIKLYDWNNSNKKIFLTVSGFRPVKRLDLFAKAFLNAAEKNKNIYWHALGGGSEFENVKRIVMNSNYSDRVTFFGNLSNNDVYCYYNNYNVFFFANVSSSEGVPVSIMEAISFGVPVIATKVGGNSEIVDKDNGFLLDESISIEKLSNVIDSCASMDKQSYFTMRFNSRNKWDSLYNSHKNLEQWLSILVGNDNK